MKFFIKAAAVIAIYFTILMMALLALSGCGTDYQTTIKDEVIKVKIPDVKAEMNAQIVSSSDSIKQQIEKYFQTLPSDLYFEGESLQVDSVGHVKKTKSRFYPNKKDTSGGQSHPIIETQTSQSDINIRRRDTTGHIPNDKRQDESFWDKFQTMIIIGVFILILSVGYSFIIKNKKGA